MNAPTIMTYHETIPTWNHGEILRMWRSNWQNAGFRVLVVGRNIAEKHPLFEQFFARIRTFPTINARRYEEACWIRWLAFEIMLEKLPSRRGIMADYDVFNQGFDKSHMTLSEPIVCHERTRVPCMVEANGQGARAIVEFLMHRDPGDAGHYSDMYAFKESLWPITGWCQEMGEAHWESAPAVHIASGAVQRSCPGADKTAFIRAQMK